MIDIAKYSLRRVAAAMGAWVAVLAVWGEGRQAARWETEEAAPGVKVLTMRGYDSISGGMQAVSVVDIDLGAGGYGLTLWYSPEGATLPEAAAARRAAAGINAGYEREAIFIKANDTVRSSVSLPPGHLRFWKHEGAVCWSEAGDVDIVYPSQLSCVTDSTAIDAYTAMTHAANILASAPVLIYDYRPVGEWFVIDALRSGGLPLHTDLASLEYEHPARHQGVRHPRSAIAVTDSAHLLLVAVDGRRPGLTEGMTAAELTRFLAAHFHPRSALNLDGGGSTTLYVAGPGVVNYPTDNGLFDHEGSRRVSTHLLVESKK